MAESTLTADAPAKINLGLHVLRKRPDGYHSVMTVLHRIEWADTIRATRAEGLSMTCSDPDLPTDGDNLCMQAARRLAEACDVDQGASLHLEKRVPYGAGLGGGSSDAAATLRLLNDLWETDASPDLLHRLAASIGSDVPFFLQSPPAALATGRGEILEPLVTGGRAYAIGRPVLVVVPPVQISTPEAYARVTPRAGDRSDLWTVVLSDGIDRWSERLTNDFEAPTVAAEPEVAAARALLQAQGARYVSLSGSGAAVYGIFDDSADADAARDVAVQAGYRAHRSF